MFDGGMIYSENVYTENTCTCRVFKRESKVVNGISLGGLSYNQTSYLEVSEKIKDATKEYKRQINTWGNEKNEILKLVKKVDALDPSKKNLFIKNFFVDEVSFPYNPPKINGLNNYIDQI